MAAERTDFVTEVPQGAVKVVLDFVRGHKPPPRELALAWNNFESYGFGLFVGGSPTPMTSIGETSATMTMAKAEVLLSDCLPAEPTPPSPTPAKATPGKPAPTPVPMPAKAEAPVQMKSGAFLVLLEFLGPMILKWLAGR